MGAIRIEGLTKTFAVKKKREGFLASLKSVVKPEYTEKIAVHSLDLSIGQGETVAFLGPNGAGKSTTIKMLAGILHPTSGTADVLGLCPWRDRNKLAYKIGTVFGQKSQLWYHLPPSDTFELMSRIYELKRSEFIYRRDDLVRRFGLEPYLHTPVRKLSLGERMRCEIAAALLHRPEIIFLDEPTIGLDVIVKQRIRELIREMNREEGTTIFLTSHDPGDMEQLCRRAVVINYGKLIFDDKVNSLKKDFLTHKTVHLKLKQPAESFALEGAEVLKSKGNGLKLSVDTSLASIESVLSLVIDRYGIEDVTVEDPPMEDIIGHIYARGGSSASSVV